ncbi:hypothetical protein DL766_003259 [Monosporascus sp. MC13-8B]|uniref:Uncharacterized protein n=1 Tax=Monosporascus cannonballus TaxID=155416 RepID=A0ABY0HFN0_9PEZI|nr:hypothetical protein DL762_003222 [Monosporascus cannonballus]RYP00825.1 hypothetical protein DL763_000550 [Monosporascus cannonballus]RYP33818.1 hypothetical protein DL766_003259 [Monosporascus sp. MC13-8B]
MPYSIATLLLVSAAMLGAKGLAAATKPSARGPSPSTAAHSETAVPMMFTGALRAGGPTVTYSGTLQSIVKQIRAENPHYPFRNRTAFPITPDDSTKVGDTGVGRSDTISATRSDGVLNAREDNVFCGVGGDGWADKEAIVEAITYLRDLTGACYALPGPGFCGRISCSYNSAVWWCNDKPKITNYPCSFFADFVQTIANECSDQWEKQTQGQAFSEDGSYNVLVGRDWC